MLRFGTAGIPLSTKDRNTIEGIKRVKELGLGAMELEFVHSVNISEANAPKIKEISSNLDIALTCHAPYYINLAALEDEKRNASIARLYKAARIAYLCGATSVAVHAGFYLGRSSEVTFEIIKDSLNQVLDKLKEEGISITISPETMGKKSQFGSMEEILKLSKIKGIMPCLDFAHLHAIEGKNNTKSEFLDILSKVDTKNVHIQVSGVEYSEKGERRHLKFLDSDFNYKEFVGALIEKKVNGIVICESPAMEEDALLLMRSK